MVLPIVFSRLALWYNVAFLMRKQLLLTASLTFAALGLAPAFAEAPVVPVRVGVHETYDRIVFDWPGEVKFRLQRNGEKASITFAAAGTIAFPRNMKDSVNRASNFVSEQDSADSVSVSFTIDPNALITVFPNDRSVVVDIQSRPLSAAEKTSIAPKLKTETKPPEPQKAPEQPPPAKEEKKPEPPKEIAAPVQPPKPEKTPEPPPATKETKPEPRKDVAAPVQPPKSEKEPQPTAPEKKDEPAPTEPAAQAQAETPVEPETPEPEYVRPKPKTFRFELGQSPTLVATLDPHIATRAVIFQRAGVGYIIFDRKLTLSPLALQNGKTALIDIEPFDMPKNSGYRFAAPPNSTLQATMDGTAWKLFLSQKQETFSVTTSLVAQPDFALGARFLLPLPDAMDPIRFTDPVVGDTLIIVPLSQSQAFNVERRTANLAILPAAQGLVVKPLSDKVIVRAVSDGIEISAEGGLLLSRASDTGASQQSPSKARAAAIGKSIFDFSTWSGKQGETFTQTRQRLQQTIVDVPEAERNRARMELARFYFARGHGEEAVSMLEYIAKQVPDLRFHNDFMALLGAAKILAYRSEDGLNDLAIQGLADQPEVALWQAVGLAQIREWKAAEEKFATKESILAGYPEPFFSRFFVLAIESALAANQIHEAADWLNFVTNSPHSKRIDPALSFLHGAIEAQAGHEEEARRAWKEAKASSDRLYKVRAELSLIDLDVSKGSLTPAQAADRLEAMRFGWRGDDLEAEILHRLGQFYIQARNVKAGINVMSRIATLYPASTLTPYVRNEMTQAFREIFLGTKEKLSPLDALTLYRQYRDLLPTGKERDDIMIRLAERLVAVDLLDQASTLLEDLAKNHLRGQERKHAILRLAAIRLLDHRPADALTALDLLGNDPLDTAMQNERVLLQARALSEQQKNDEALDLLKGHPSREAALLHVDIAMHEQQWNDAAKTLMALVGPPPSIGSLSDEKAKWLVNAALAYALADDQINLDKLAIDYSPSMAKNIQNGTFQMLTRPEKTGQLRDLAAAQAQLSQVDMFQSFLNTYRKNSSGAGTK
ncbi:MAG: hypothetical protein PHE27_04175 [Alphaproteobacteria bacterium]|nr:hypothetical protein [Alphaproteobacteria bacterium]